eukprot:c27370_g1_i1 orf=412-2169(-)
MGSVSSTHAPSVFRGQGHERQHKKKKQGGFIPLLHSFGCGGTSVCKAEEKALGCLANPPVCRTLECKNVPVKATGANLSPDICPLYEIPGIDRDRFGSVCVSDDIGSSASSEVPLSRSVRSRTPDIGRPSKAPVNYSSSSSSVVYVDSKAKRSRDSTGDEVHSMLMGKRHSSPFCEITGSNRVQLINEGGLHEFGIDSQQIGMPASLEVSAALPEAVNSQKHDLFAASSSQSYRTIHVLNNSSGNINGDRSMLEHGETVCDHPFTPSELVPVRCPGIEPSTIKQPLVSHDSLRADPDASSSENADVFHVETFGLIAQSPGDASGSFPGDVSAREARRTSRRRLWDALTRATSRRRVTSPPVFVASEEGDALGPSSDSWGLANWSSNRDHDRMANPGSFLVGGNVELEERRWSVRSQVWALQHLSDGSVGHSRPCAAGLHADGRCSCETYVMTDETNTRASISRIVMLADALFEVLDEIHRQSVALSRSASLSLVSLPAPDYVVDSFPLRNYKKSDKLNKANEEAAQCYICLVEYEDGDYMRVLPCDHEYHRACIDKWLKEVHRVCPLCRGNVCEPISRESALLAV